jgi:hypothetical protein
LIYFQFHHSIPFLYVMFSNLILILLIFLVLLLNFFFNHSIKSLYLPSNLFLFQFWSLLSWFLFFFYPFV